MKNDIWAVMRDVDKSLGHLAHSPCGWLDEEAIRDEWFDLRRDLQKSLQDNTTKREQLEEELKQLHFVAMGFAVGRGEARWGETWMSRGKEKKEMIFGRLMKAAKGLSADTWLAITAETGHDLAHYWRVYRDWERLQNIHRRYNRKNLSPRIRRARQLRRMLQTVS